MRARQEGSDKGRWSGWKGDEGGTRRWGVSHRESSDGCLHQDKAVTSVSKYELCKY